LFTILYFILCPLTLFLVVNSFLFSKRRLWAAEVVLYLRYVAFERSEICNFVLCCSLRSNFLEITVNCGSNIKRTLDSYNRPGKA
jgi:hypothetical protein